LGIKIVSVAEVAPVYTGSKGNISKKAFNISVTQKKKGNQPKNLLKARRKHN
jgi:hypothetical protein